MWLLWPLRWCFGTRANNRQPAPEARQVEEPCTATAAPADELRQHLRSHDSLGAVVAACKESEVVDTTALAHPQSRLPSLQTASASAVDGDPAATSPAAVATPNLGPHRGRRSFASATSAAGLVVSASAKVGVGRKRATPESQPTPPPSLRVLIPGQDMMPDQATTPAGLPRSPLPFLTPALPSPSVIPSCVMDAGDSDQAAKPEDAPLPVLATPFSAAKPLPTPSPGAPWDGWAHWDLRSPSADVPRTPLPNVTPMLPGCKLVNPEDRILRRRNTPFEVRVEQDMLKYGQRSASKSASPKAARKGRDARMKPGASAKPPRKENMEILPVTPQVHVAAWPATSALLQSKTGLETPSPQFPEFVTTPGLGSSGESCTPQIVGINNPPSRFREDKRLRVHETPFESRVESFIEKEDSYKRRLSASMMQSS